MEATPNQLLLSASTHSRTPGPMVQATPNQLPLSTSVQDSWPQDAGHPKAAACHSSQPRNPHRRAASQWPSPLWGHPHEMVSSNTGRPSKALWCTELLPEVAPRTARTMTAPRMLDGSLCVWLSSIFTQHSNPHLFQTPQSSFPSWLGCQAKSQTGFGGN